MLDEYEKTLEQLYEMLDGELSLPLRLRRPERIECIKGMIGDVVYAVKCLRPSDKVHYHPTRSMICDRVRFYTLAD